MSDTTNIDQQTVSFEKLEAQCSYVPFLMNKSKASRDYIKNVLAKFLIFVGFCALTKLSSKIMTVLVFYCIYMVIDIYIKAIAVLRKHMINNLDKAVIVAYGVVLDKRHSYNEGLIRLFNRGSDNANANVYRYNYYSQLKVMTNDTEEAIWLPCTSTTYEQAVAGDPAIIIEFDEEYELGKRCCFLNIQTTTL